MLTDLCKEKTLRRRQGSEKKTTILYYGLPHVTPSGRSEEEFLAAAREKGIPDDEAVFRFQLAFEGSVDDRTAGIVRLVLIPDIAVVEFRQINRQSVLTDCLLISFRKA